MNANVQRAFRALADPTRREILRQLSEEEMTITQVVEKFDLTRTAVRKHLAILEEGHLITLTPRGKERVSRLDPRGLRTAADWFEFFDRYWDTALESLKAAIEKDRP